MKPAGSIWKDRILPRAANVVRNDFWRKVFSLLFAVLLTAYAHLVIKMKMDMVKLQLKDVPVLFVPANGENFTVVPGEASLTVDLDVEVPGSMKNLKNADFYVECPVTKAQIDAKDPKPLKLNRDFVKTRREIDNLSVQAIRPDSIQPDLDYFLEKDVPVYPVFDPGELVPGYRVRIPNMLDKQVRIRGPKKHLETIDHLETEKIPLSNVNRGFTHLVRPVLPGEAKNTDVKILSDQLSVKVEVEKNNPRAIERVPVRILTDKDADGQLTIASIQPETVTVMVDDVPEKIAPEQLSPYVDLSGVKEASVYDVEVKCWTEKDYIKVVEVIPSKIRVTVALNQPSQADDPPADDSEPLP